MNIGIMTCMYSSELGKVNRPGDESVVVRRVTWSGSMWERSSSRYLPLKAILVSSPSMESSGTRPVFEPTSAASAEIRAAGLSESFGLEVISKRMMSLLSLAKMEAVRAVWDRVLASKTQEVVWPVGTSCS